MGANTIFAKLSVLDFIHRQAIKDKQIIKKSQTGKVVVHQQAIAAKKVTSILSQTIDACDEFVAGTITDRELKRKLRKLNLQVITILKHNIIL